MRKKNIRGGTSVLLALSIILSCFFGVYPTVGAVDKTGVKDTSASSTAAGSIVEKDGFTWDNASVYFLLTDRFKNGNTSNDHSYGRATDKNGQPLSGWESSPGTFHGGDFAGITQTIKEGYFNNLGVNALWISAPYEQIHGYVDSGKGFAHYSYHGYYVLDYTQTDANFGTAQEFETMVDTAHEHGLRVIIDIVMNHAGYNSVLDMETYNYGTLLDGASDFKYRLDNVAEVNSHIDFKTSAADWGRWWGKQWIRSDLPGYTKPGGDDFTMALVGLPDFITESKSKVDIPPILQTKWTQEGRLSQETKELDSYLASKGKTRTVSNSISYWLSTWVRDYGVDGFRCDTAKHVDLESWNNLKTTCVDALKEWRKNNPDKPGADWKQDFWMTGECWDHNVGWGCDGYFTQGGFDSMINFETQGAGLLSSGRIADVYSGYADSINTNSSFNALSYISSHDSTITRSDMIYNGSAFLLLPGGIQIYYGDESNRPLAPGIGFDGNGGSGHSLRSDMNWNSLDKDILAHWQKVGTFRNNHVAVGAGSNTKLTSSNGIAFGRTYDKNGVTDKCAGVIGCSSNTNVTIDVSPLWADGEYVVNAYDGSSSLVTGGKVTFNSGVNGTILMEGPNGQPLVAVTGEAQFYGTETLTVSLVDCESAKVSVDGGNKFSVKNGDTFTIGKTAYKNDNISVKVEAENDKAKSEAVFTFLKLGELNDKPVIDPDDTKPTNPTVTISQTSTLTINSKYGTPKVYAWTGADTAQLGAWPGTDAKEISDGVYQVTMNVPADTSFNVVIHNGGQGKSADITGLYNGAVVKVTNESYATEIENPGIKEGGSGGDTPIYNGSVTITVIPYDANSSYYLYLWDDNKKSLAGEWPGTALTEKDENGNYKFTVEGYESVNAIVNMGSGAGQTGDITGVKNGATIEITNAGCTSYKMAEPVIVLSPYEKLKKEAREILAMTSTDYTTSSWNAVRTALNNAEKYIKLGDGATEEENLLAELEALQKARASLKLAQPNLLYAVTGKSVLKGVTVADGDVTVKINNKVYNAKADDVTGIFTLAIDALSSSSTIGIDVTRNGISGTTYTYNMSGGDIDTGDVPVNPGILGDVDGDGEVTVSDATLIQKFKAGFNVTINIDVADVNGDGEITVSDATLIQKARAGIATI